MPQKVAVLGAGGVMGRLVCAGLEDQGHEVVRVSRADGVDVLDRAALEGALADVDGVVDCLNRQSLTVGPAVEFFRAAADNVASVMLEGAQPTGGRPRRGPRVVCVSIVNCWEPRVNRWIGYYQGKSIQEQVYRDASSSGLRVSIVRTTQWFELLPRLVEQIRLGPAAVVPAMVSRPMAAADAAAILVEQVLAPTLPSVVEVCGPEQMDLARAAARVNARSRQVRRVIRVPLGRTPLGDGSLVPSAPDVVAGTTFEQWLQQRETS